MISKCCKATVWQDGSRGTVCDKCRTLCRTIEDEVKSPPKMGVFAPNPVPTPPYDSPYSDSNFSCCIVTEDELYQLWICYINRGKGLFDND